MEKFYEYLQSIGISDPPDVFEVIQKLSIEKIIEVSTKCYTLTETSGEQIKDHSIFNFSASSTISGGIRPCADVECRIRNVYELSAFAALYADKVVIPNPFEHIYHHLSSDFNFSNEEQEYFFVSRLIGDIVIMLNLKPLVKSKLLTINPQVKSYCKECWEQELVKQKKIQDAFERIEKDAINDLNRNIKFTLDTKKSIVMSGARDYIGQEVLRFAMLPKVLKPYIKSIPYTFKSDEVKKLELWQPVVIPIFEDLILQKYSMLNLNTAYLTNRKIETDIIHHLDNNIEDRSKEKALIDGLVHRLPFVEGASLDMLVQLRGQESEAFDVYRDSVAKTVKDTSEETNTEVIKKVVEERIKPQLHKLDQIVKSHKDEFNAKGKRKVVFNSLLFTAGLFVNQISGIDIKTILALGGAHTLAEVYSDFSEARAVPKQIKNSDYYFLWRLEKSSSR